MGNPGVQLEATAEGIVDLLLRDFEVADQILLGQWESAEDLFTEVCGVMAEVSQPTCPIPHNTIRNTMDAVCYLWMPEKCFPRITNLRHHAA